MISGFSMSDTAQKATSRIFPSPGFSPVVELTLVEIKQTIFPSSETASHQPSLYHRWLVSLSNHKFSAGLNS
jgi:hypothetical protein